MIKELELTNFRCFNSHKVNFRPLSILVGRNNAGKSTIVEALRLLSLVTNRYKALEFHSVPDWLEISRYQRGVSPSLKGLEINFVSMFHEYGGPPAKIRATFSTNEIIEIYLGEKESIHAVLFDSNRRLVDTKAKALRTSFPYVDILPQIGPLAINEYVLVGEYVRRAMASALSSLHFRNQLNIFYKEYFHKFKNLSEDSWSGLQIQELQGKGDLPGGKNELDLIVRDGDFVAEIGWMGHGLQMWLQIMWFLALSEGSETVILDEPDVYMHADLQRRLIRLLKDNFPQVIITTHSVEIMAEVEAENILVIDRFNKESEFACSLPDVQRVINQVGSVHNIQLARLWNSRRFILVEGEDISLLKYFHDKLFPNTDVPLDIIPSLSIGGWGGWNYIISSPMRLKNAKGEDIVTYCILDRDYYTKEEIEKRMEEANRSNIQLYVFEKKELENYLLSPCVVARAINTKLGKKDFVKTEKVEEILDKIAGSLKDRVFDLLSAELYKQNKASGVTKANECAREILHIAWQTFEGRLAVIPGSEALPKLMKWAQDNFCSLSKLIIVQSFDIKEIPEEIKFLLGVIENNEKFY